MHFIKTISNLPGSDAELVDRFKESGDLNVLAALYERYMDLVFGVCLKYLKDKEVARDAVMHIFEELTDKLLRYEVEHFRSWLHTVAKNHCLMQLRSPRTLKTVEMNPDVMQSEEAVHLNGMPDKEADFLRLEKCLETLSSDQKQSINLFYLQRKCYKDIAEITGQDWNKVRSLIQNGRRNLKICMDQQKVSVDV